MDLKPGSILNPGELAKSLGVSRTPIKEALIFLQAEEWVLRDRSHFMVTPLSLDRLNQITEIRYLMEIQANIWAMHRITPEEFDDLLALEKEIMRFRDTSTSRQIHELEIRFHQKIFQATKNPQLAQLLERMLGHYLRFWLSMNIEINIQSFHADRREIIRAIEMKDEDRVRAAATAHIKKSMDDIMRPLNG